MTLQRYQCDMNEQLSGQLINTHSQGVKAQMNPYKHPQKNYSGTIFFNKAHICQISNQSRHLNLILIVAFNPPRSPNLTIY